MFSERGLRSTLDWPAKLVYIGAWYNCQLVICLSYAKTLDPGLRREFDSMERGLQSTLGWSLSASGDSSARYTRSE